MNPKPWLLLALATPLFSPALASGSGNAPVIRLFEPPIVVESPAPAVLVNIPKYSLPTAEREIVAACLILEAANQGDYGMQSVMAVIRNRARAHPELFAPTVLRPKQFSALNKLTAGSESLRQVLARAKRDVMWTSALKIVDAAVHEAWHDPTGGATHYTRTGERTHWTRRLAKTVTIGAHSFYR